MKYLPLNSVLCSLSTLDETMSTEFCDNSTNIPLSDDSYSITRIDILDFPSSNLCSNSNNHLEG